MEPDTICILLECPTLSHNIVSDPITNPHRIYVLKHIILSESTKSVVKYPPYRLIPVLLSFMGGNR